MSNINCNYIYDFLKNNIGKEYCSLKMIDKHIASGIITQNEGDEIRRINHEGILAVNEIEKIAEICMELYNKITGRKLVHIGDNKFCKQDRYNSRTGSLVRKYLWYKMVDTEYKKTPFVMVVGANFYYDEPIITIGLNAIEEIINEEEIKKYNSLSSFPLKGSLIFNIKTKQRKKYLSYDSNMKDIYLIDIHAIIKLKDSPNIYKIIEDEFKNLIEYYHYLLGLNTSFIEVGNDEELNAHQDYNGNEGNKTLVTIATYERDASLRKKCIEKYGYNCVVCGLNMEKMYGEIGKEYIHVHHIIPVSEMSNYENINHEENLVTLCPNCHSMIHRKVNGKYLTIDKLKEIVKKYRK